MARQVNAQEAIVSITTKMETMLQSVKEQYDQSILVLNSIETVLKNDSLKELQKQTSILASIEAKIGAGGQSTNEDAVLGKNLEILSKGLGKLIKSAQKLDPKTGDNIKSFLEKVTEGLVKLNSEVDEKKAETISNAVATLGKGILIFGLAMTLFTILAPTAMLGSFLFGKTINILLKSIGEVKGDPKATGEVLTAISGLGMGVIYFGLAMAFYAVIGIPAMIGAMLFGQTIKILMKSAGVATKEGAEAIKAITGLGKGLLAFIGVMLIATIAAPIILVGALLLSLTFRLLSWGLKKMGEPPVVKGVKAILGISLGIILLGLTIMAFAASVKVTDALFTILTVGAFALAFFVVGKFFNEILKGGFAILAISISVVFLGLSLMLFKSVGFTFEDAAILGTVVVGLGGAMALAGLVFVEIALGAAAMIVVGASLIILTLGLSIYKASGFKMEDALSLGAAIGILGTEMALFGLASPFIILGAAAMTLSAIALLPITGALAVFKTIGWQKGTDDESLKSALGAIISGFLGGDMPGGLLASIKFAAQAAARSALLFVAVPPMILASAALLPIALGLAAFKKIGFTKEDSGNLEFAIGSIVKAFSIVTDKDRQKSMGFEVNWLNLMFGIESLSRVGSTLASLAEGIQAFANLEVTTWEVINPGTKNAQLVIKERRKMNETDFDNAAYGMAKVINAIAEPFANVGKLTQGQKSGNPLYDSVFGNDYIAAGIDSLKNVGGTLVSLAYGVQSWANLEITEYEVINAGTKDAKLVPKSVRKMSDTDFTNASLNISKVLGFLANELARIGEMEAKSEGFFSGGNVTKGKEVIAGIGGNILSMADAIVKLANSEITSYKVNEKGELVPVDTRKLNDTDYKAATETIKTMLGTLIDGLIEAGVKADDNEDEIEAILEILPSISEALGSSADTLKKWIDMKDQAVVGTNNITSFISTINSIFDPATNKNIPKSNAYFSMFASNVEKMATSANQFDKIATNFERMDKAMKGIKESVNSFDLQKLTTTDSLFKSMAILSKSPEAMASQINQTLKDAFKDFSEAIKQIIEESGGAAGGAAASAGGAVATAPVAASAPTGKPGEKTPPSPSITPQQLQQAFTAALSSVTVKTKEVQF